MNETITIFLLALGTVAAGMAVLTAVVLLLRTLGRRSRRASAGPERDPSDAELVAVLAAAAHAALGAPVRIHRIHVHREAAFQRWSGAGRLDIMISHRLEPKR